MNHVMLDLETMGNGPTAAIVAIGACVFDPHGVGAGGPQFGISVDLDSAMKHGLHVDASTVLWWMRQSDTARERTFPTDAPALPQAIDLFNLWIREQDSDVVVWGNGATFDNVIIRSAFRAVGLEAPWSYKNDRCYRTLVNLLPEHRRPTLVPYGMAHYALDDAITQVLHLQKVWKELGL